MTTEIFIPKMGANIEAVEIGKVNVAVGDSVKKGEVLFEIITEKATFDIAAEADGFILSLECKAGEDLQVLDVVGYIGDKGEKAPEIKKKALAQPTMNVAQPTPTKSISAAASVSSGKIKATPAAKKLAKERGIDINEVFKDHTGIIKENDVLNHPSTMSSARQQPAIAGYTEESIGPVKKVEISKLSMSKDCIYSLICVEVSSNQMKNAIKKASAKDGLSISPGEFISFKAALLLKKYPLLNAYYHDGKFRVYNKINIGVAMNPYEDLFVPVIHDADTLGLSGFTEKFREYVMKSIKKEFAGPDFENGTFTITDLSGHNVHFFQPVINANQSAILGICSEHESYSSKDNKPVCDPRITLILAFDHRILNGKYAAAFLNELKNSVEN